MHQVCHKCRQDAKSVITHKATNNEIVQAYHSPYLWSTTLLLGTRLIYSMIGASRSEILPARLAMRRAAAKQGSLQVKATYIHQAILVPRSRGMFERLKTRLNA